MTRPGKDTPEISVDVGETEGKVIVPEVICDVPGIGRAHRTSAVRNSRVVREPGDIEVARGAEAAAVGAGGVKGPSGVRESSAVGGPNAGGSVDLGCVLGARGSSVVSDAAARQEVSGFPAPVNADEVTGEGAGYGRGSAAQGDVEPGHPDAGSGIGAGESSTGRPAEVASSGAVVEERALTAPDDRRRQHLLRHVVHDSEARSDDERRRLAWVYLSRVAQGPCAPLSALIAAVGVLEAARAVRERELPDAFGGAVRARRDIDRAEADLEVVRRLGGRVVTPDDAEWPAWRMLGLGQLEAGRDPDSAVPLVLWVRGPRSLLDISERALAVVGARCSTGYGEHVTGEIVGGLAARGWTVVSGAAFGIDAMAHRAALAVGGPTVAVLACGVDRPYPAQHDRLLSQIAETGLVVSEYPPGAVARKHCFLARNRLVAALADGVLVVEAGMRSGARNTVKWARRLGRPALAVPGPVSSAASAGCHHMIREGEAHLVTRVEEVIAEAGPLRLSVPDMTARAASGAAGTVAGDQLIGDEATVYTALPASGGCPPADLAVRTELAIAAVRAALVALELAGLAVPEDAGWRRSARS